MARHLPAHAGLPVVVSSAQNIDRLVTVYRAARRAGRMLLVDLYTATVAQATGRPTIPQPGFPRLGVFVPRRQRVRVKQSGEFDRTHAVRPFRVFPEQLLADPGRYVVLTGTSTVPELLAPARCAAASSCGRCGRATSPSPAGQRLLRPDLRAGVPLVRHHTSGHAPGLRPQASRRGAPPRQVVPIHTEGATSSRATSPR